MERSFFKDLPEARLQDRIVILDVDGTLVGDGEDDMDEDTKQKLTLLSQSAQVYLFSNANRAERLRKLVENTNVHVVVSPHKKPNPRVLDSVPALSNSTRVVIGDRYLTDGLLAILTHSEFMCTRRVRTHRERLFVRFLYLLDALFGKVVCYVARLLRP